MNTTTQLAVAPSITVSGYSHLAIVTTDLEAARRFYIDLLGFRELRRPDFAGFDGMWLQVGSLQLHFIVNQQMPVSGPGFPHFALHVPAERFAETMDGLRNAGVDFFIEPRSRVDFGTTVWAAFVKDPSGNVIELTDVGPIATPGPLD